MMSKVIKDTHASGRESMDMILSECLNAVNEVTRDGVLPQHSGYSYVFRAVLPPWVTKMNVSMLVLCNHMAMDQQPSVCIHITEQRHVKRSYDGIVANEADAPLCERPHQWLDPTKVVDIVSHCREARAGEHGL